MFLENYEDERLLSNIKASSPGFDNIPNWFYRDRSFEITEIVTHILNLYSTLAWYLNSDWMRL